MDVPRGRALGLPDTAVVIAVGLLVDIGARAAIGLHAADAAGNYKSK